MKNTDALLWSMLACALLTGCSTQSATLLVRPEAKPVAYSQSFTQCVAGRTADGTDEFVLVTDDKTAQSNDKPLHQVLYLKVLWRPMNGTERNVGANASLVWYVTSDPTDRMGDLLEYHGSAHATVVNKGDVVKVTLRDGLIKPQALRGGLSDPCGVSRIEGSFVAINDPEKLREILNNSRLRTAAASAE